jgi:hypothetical protein
VEGSNELIIARHSGGMGGGRLSQLSGELMLRGSCLVLRSARGDYALVWPSDAAARRQADARWAVSLATPQGPRSLATGSRITVGGYGGARSAVEGAHIVEKLARDCPDGAWIVQGLP